MQYVEWYPKTLTCRYKVKVYETKDRCNNWNEIQQLFEEKVKVLWNYRKMCSNHGFSYLPFVLQEIREKIPNDPLEAELLMMAEAVAGVGNESDSDSEKEVESESKSTYAKKLISIGEVLLFFITRHRIFKPVFVMCF